MLPATSPRPRTTTVALTALLALSLAGCVAPKTQTTPTEPPSPTASADTHAGEGTTGQGIDALYEQQITWEPCEDFECATVVAPLDWEEPEKGTIELAVNRSTATGDVDSRIGSLLINPGGPGGSGTGFLGYAVQTVISAPVLEVYDIVAFDPRGVGDSSAVSCGDDAQVDAFLTADVPMDDQADVDAARELTRQFGAACLASTGPLLGEVDTVSAAKDLDLLRAVLGDDQLHFLGFSYGTFLGATYADLFPDKVGKLVLDGALDPSMSSDDLSLGQAEGFENALRAYVEDCQAGARCPLRGGVDEGMQQIADLVGRVEDQSLPTSDGQEVNGTLAYYGIISSLYEDAVWPYLTQALTEALRNNVGDTLFLLASEYLDRNPDGTYRSNLQIAFTAINCLDYPMPARTYDEMVAFAEQVAAKAPTFGKDFAMATGCESWPFQSTAAREEITAAGAAPIVVIGTTGDPATPYAWAEALAGQLESGHLVTWKGEGHTAYGRSNDCVADAVDQYLVEGAVPEDGLTC